MDSNGGTRSLVFRNPKNVPLPLANLCGSLDVRSGGSEEEESVGFKHKALLPFLRCLVVLVVMMDVGVV